MSAKRKQSQKKHKEKGDNYENNINKLKNKHAPLVFVLWLFGTVVFVWAAIGGGLADWAEVEQWFKKKKAQQVPPPSTKFSILILPFEEYCMYGEEKQAIDVGKAIYKRFTQLKIERNIDIEAFYADKVEVNDLNFEKIKRILDKFEYDLLIYGDYQSFSCNEKNENQACVKFVFNDDGYSEKLLENSSVLEDELKPFSLQGLLNGELQGEVDFIVFSVLGLIDKYKGKVEDSVEKFNFIYDTLLIKQERILQELVVLNADVGNMDRVRVLIEEYKSNNNLLDNEKALFYHALRIIYFVMRKDEKRLIQAKNDLDQRFYNETFNHTKNVENSFHLLGEYLAVPFPKTAIAFLEAALELSYKFKDEQEIAKIFHDKGRAYFYLENYQEAIIMMDSALLKYDDQLFENEWLKVKALEIKSFCYLKLGDAKKAKKTLYFIVDNIKSKSETWAIPNVITNYVAIGLESGNTSGLIGISKKGLCYCETHKAKKQRLMCEIGFKTSLGILYGKIGKDLKSIKWCVSAMKDLKQITPENKQECDALKGGFLGMLEHLNKNKNKNKKEIAIYANEVKLLENKCSTLK